MSKPHDALVQSVKARLVQRAHAERVDPNQVLTRFAIERFLYRLSKSRHGTSFLLKGSNLLLVWFGTFVRPTRDADLLGLEDFGAERLREIFRDVCGELVEPDGMIFDPASATVRLIRLDQPAGGHRVNLLGRLGKARLHVQIDVGLGDSVTPPPEWLDFLRKSGLDDAETDLEIVVDDLAEFLAPVLAAVHDPVLELGTWPPGGPWSPLEIKEEVFEAFERLERPEPRVPLEELERELDLSVPGLRESIREGMEAPLEDCVEELDW